MNEFNIITNIITLAFFSITLLVIGVCLFFIGYFVGKQHGSGVYQGVSNKPNSFFDNIKQDKLTNKISIDSTRVVTEIKTDGMERKYEKLGEVKQSNENISQSINKLRNLKR